MFDVYAETFGWQILDMAYRSLNQIVLSEILIYCLRLRRRLNDYEVLGHQSVSNFRLPISNLQDAVPNRPPIGNRKSEIGNGSQFLNKTSTWQRSYQFPHFERQKRRR